MSHQDRKQVFIGNLSYDATEREVQAAFEREAVAVTQVRIVVDQNTQRPKGFAFVDIHPDCAYSITEIIEIMDGVEFNGRPARLGEARLKPRSDSRSHSDRTQRREGGPRDAHKRGRIYTGIRDVWNE